MAHDAERVKAIVGGIADQVRAGQTLAAAGRVEKVEVAGDAVSIVLVCADYTREQRFAVEDAIIEALAAAGVDEDDVTVRIMTGGAGAGATAAGAAGAVGGASAGAPGGAKSGEKKKLPLYSGPPAPELIRGVKATIAVASGKGGVGKSTVAVNLALALHMRGARVGIMDIDIYGPSLGLLMGVRDRPVAGEDGKIWPLEKHGVSLMSLAFFSEPGEPVIWRGPMVGKLIKQFIDDVNWGELDYLIVDLPPGTGDAQLALVQDTKVSGAVIVTTPSELALIDARKGHEMFNQVKVPVLGIVENMSYYICPKCEKRHDIFDHGGGKRAADTAGVPFLGELPLDPTVRAAGDGGEPAALRGPGDTHAQPFFALADRLLALGAGAHAPAERPS